MGKKLAAFICINGLVIICGALFLWRSYNPEPFNDLGMTRHQAGKVVTSVEHGSRSAGDIKIIAVLCAFLLVGCTTWLFYRKMKKDNPVDPIALKRSLNKVSNANDPTGFSPKIHHQTSGGSIKREEIQTTSLRDWAIALLILSGGLLLPVVIAVFFGFSHFW